MITSKGKFLVALILLALAFMPAVAQEGEGTAPDLTAAVEVEVQATGTLPNPPETYKIVLTADDESSPLPEGSSDGTYTLEIKGPGTASFPEIKFTAMGVFNYTISQTKGSEPTAISYDERVYKLKVSVYRDENNNFYIAEALREEGKAEKLDICLFENKYKAAGKPASGVSNFINIGECFE